jgi:hypothetical protein
MKFEMQKGAFYSDETGAKIPYARVTKSERLREAKAVQLANIATKLNEQMRNFKSGFAKVHAEVIEAILSENSLAKTDTKGNATWYNFDRSIKVEVNVNEAIAFDSILIEAAKDKLLTIIDSNVQAEDFIKSIVMDAFQTTAGKLDTKRVLGLKKHTSRISNPAIKAEWNAAMELIDKSISRPSSKSYFRIWHKIATGEYAAVDLNFSSI